MKVQRGRGSDVRKDFNFFDDSLSSLRDASPTYCCVKGLVVQNLKSKVNSQQMFIQNIMMANYLFGAGSSAL